MTDILAGFTKRYMEKLKGAIDILDAKSADEAIAAIRRVWEAGGQILTLGNGGSAMTALHFITDWNKGVFLATGRPFRGRSLIDNMGMITAYANDMSYADVFVEQLKNLAGPSDLVLAISGSGNSANVLKAVAYANEIGCETVGLVGYSGGKLKDMVKYPVWANINDMQVCEDVHAIFGHVVMQALCGMIK